MAQVEIATQEVAPEGPKVGGWGWKDAGSLELQEKHGAYKAIKPKRYISCIKIQYVKHICIQYICIYIYTDLHIHILEVLPVWCLAELTWKVYKTLGQRVWILGDLTAKQHLECVTG